MQSELDEKAEALAALEQQHRQATGTSEELSHIRQRLEQQMAQADSHIKHLEQELQREVQRGDVTKQNLVAAQQDYEHLRVSHNFSLHLVKKCSVCSCFPMHCRKRLQRCQMTLQ